MPLGRLRCVEPTQERAREARQAHDQDDPHVDAPLAHVADRAEEGAGRADDDVGAGRDERRHSQQQEDGEPDRAQGEADEAAHDADAEGHDRQQHGLPHEGVGGQAKLLQGDVQVAGSRELGVVCCKGRVPMEGLSEQAG